ncbi:hypothetical protein EYF80_043147 [Liparis tanakae]|uniref:Uncharacterized protein n=1 Tax=Liparis tanakae TaxID=230148 RepID=A0A4Z2FZC9_9TELE|nr:hypothetical protein EYF80_043147 [Liparis tanakae]
MPSQPSGSYRRYCPGDTSDSSSVHRVTSCSPDAKQKEANSAPSVIQDGDAKKHQTRLPNIGPQTEERLPRDDVHFLYEVTVFPWWRVVNREAAAVQTGDLLPYPGVLSTSSWSPKHLLLESSAPPPGVLSTSPSSSTSQLLGPLGEPTGSLELSSHHEELLPGPGPLETSG